MAHFAGHFQSLPAQADGMIQVPSHRYSDLGPVAGGSTVAAGTPIPATAGRIALQPGASAFVRITGTAAVQGDAVHTTFEGLRTSFPTNPAQRRDAAAGPGAPGTVLVDGTIELSLSSSNADANYLHWFLIKKV